LVQTPDGGYAIAGQVSTYNNGSWGYFIRTDNTGGLLWSKLIFSRNFYPEILDMTLTSDGGFALAGITPSPAYYDMYLVKLNSTGNFEWARSTGGNSTDIPFFIKQTSDGGLLMGGLSFSYGDITGQDMFIVKTTSAGNLQWARNIGSEKSETGTDALEVPGGYVIAGTSLLVRLRSDGKYLGARTLDSTGYTGIAAATTYSKNGFSVAGSYASFFDGTQELFIAKFDKRGNTCSSFDTKVNVKDTGALVTQIVPVVNANTIVSDGAGVTFSRVSTNLNRCPAPTFIASYDSTLISMKATEKFRIMPNPVTDQLQLHWNNETNNAIQIAIFSLEGKQLTSIVYNALKGYNNCSIPVGNLRAGIYLLKVSSAKEQKTTRFIKK
jgi:hypothetical protein